MDSILNQKEIDEFSNYSIPKLFTDAKQQLNDLLTSINTENTAKAINVDSEHSKLDFFHKLSNLMNTSRRINLFACHARSQVSETRNAVDERVMGYENISYEVHHLRRQIDDCLNFKCNLEELDMENADSFYNRLTPQGKQDITDEYSLTLARLKGEIRDRLELKTRLTNMEASRIELTESIKSHKDKMNGLNDCISQYLESINPLEHILGAAVPRISLDSCHHNLCTVLYALYFNLSCHLQNFACCSVRVELCENVCHLDNSVCKLLHPYAIVLDVTIDGMSVSVVFWALRVNNMVATKVMCSDTASDFPNIFDSVTLLDFIFEHDSGNLPTNSINFHEFKNLKIRGGVSAVCQPLGRFYAWAQWIVNSTVLFDDSVQLMNTRASIKTTICEAVLTGIISRLETRIYICRFLRSLAIFTDQINLPIKDGPLYVEFIRLLSPSFPQTMNVKLAAMSPSLYFEKSGMGLISDRRNIPNLYFQTEIGFENCVFTCHIQIPVDFPESACIFSVPEQSLVSASTANAISAELSVVVIKEFPSEGTHSIVRQFSAMVAFLNNVANLKDIDNPIRGRDRIIDFKRNYF